LTSRAINLHQSANFARAGDRHDLRRKDEESIQAPDATIIAKHSGRLIGVLRLPKPAVRSAFTGGKFCWGELTVRFHAHKSEGCQRRRGSPPLASMRDQRHGIGSRRLAKETRVTARRTKLGLCITSCLMVLLASAGFAATDPLTTKIDTRDAERFAALFARSGGKPDAALLQREYLDNGGRGIEVFMSGRIENAANLATAIANDPDRYAYAIRTCLPLVASLDGELRATYLAYRGLLPDRQLPAVYIVFGAANSGGTAKPDAQVIGLESMCGLGTTPQQFRSGMRNIFAHEVAHTFQPNVWRLYRLQTPLDFGR
jgi:hypothetical protein